MTSIPFLLLTIGCQPTATIMYWGVATEMSDDWFASSQGWPMNGRRSPGMPHNRNFRASCKSSNQCDAGRVSEQIRTAAQADVPSMAALAGIRREQYARYQPLFWRPAPAASDKHGAYLGRLVASDKVISLVSEDTGELTGFLIATLNPAPPVYDPGGLSCDIDDFVVTPAANWATTGVRLLRAALAEAGQRGAVQAVVVTAHLDEPKREALRACGLEVASEWWVTPQGL